MIGIIAACTINGVIGINKNGTWTLPFHYPDDMRHFKELTSGNVVIMGRNTYESIGKPLPNRENIVISSLDLNNKKIKQFKSIKDALLNEKLILREHSVDIWFIGGARIYQEAMLYADEIHLTITPDIINDESSIMFPWINPIMFELVGYQRLTDPPSDKLICALFKRTKQFSYHEDEINKFTV
jgi:dihydrofolate reductase